MKTAIEIQLRVQRLVQWFVQDLGRWASAVQIQFKLRVLLLGGLLEVRQSETGSCSAITQRYGRL